MVFAILNVILKQDPTNLLPRHFFLCLLEGGLRDLRVVGDGVVAHLVDQVYLTATIPFL